MQNDKGRNPYLWESQNSSLQEIFKKFETKQKTKAESSEPNYALDVLGKPIQKAADDREAYYDTPQFLAVAESRGEETTNPRQSYRPNADYTSKREYTNIASERKFPSERDNTLPYALPEEAVNFTDNLKGSVEGTFPVSWQDYPHFDSVPVPYSRNNAGQGNAPYHTAISSRIELPSMPDSSKDTSVVTSFLDGIKLYGKRMANNLGYLYANSAYKSGDEELIPKVIEEFELTNGDIVKTPLESIERRLDEINRERFIYDRSIRRAEHPLSEAENKRSRELEIERSILSEIAELKRNGTSPLEVGKYIDDIIVEGNSAIKNRREARIRAESMPQPKGWALGGEITSSLVQGAIPIAAGIIYPPLGIALGSLSVSTMVGQSFAEANIEMDIHEKNTGERVPDWQRNIYGYTVAGVDMLLGGLMQSRYLKGVSAPLFNSLRKTMLGRITKSEIAQKELGSLMRKPTNNLYSSVAEEIASVSGMQGAANSASVVTRDLVSTVYKNPDEYPALTEILGDAFESGAMGVASGVVFGGVRSMGGRAIQPLRRRINGDVRLLNSSDGKTYEYLGTDKSGERYLVMDDRGNRSYIPKSETYNQRIMSPEQFEEASKKPFSLALSIPDEKPMIEIDPNRPRKLRVLLDPDLLWEKDHSSPEMLELKHFRVDDISKQLGVNVKRYSYLRDVPKNLRAELSEGDNTVSFYNPQTKEVGIIVENIKHNSQVEIGILRNGVVNKGLKAVLGNDYDNFLDRVSENIPPTGKEHYSKFGTKREQASEYLADLAKDSDIDPNMWQQVSLYMRDIIRRKFGIGEVSDEDIRYMIWKAKNRIKADDTIEEMHRKNAEEKRLNMRIYKDGKRLR